MKKVFISLFTAAVLFSACSSDDNQTPSDGRVGELQVAVNFEGVERSTKAALSTALPVTKWANVKQVQMFLYKADDGTVAYSQVITPTADGQKSTWTNIPVGTYELALVANVKSGTDNVATSLNGGTVLTEFNPFNVREKSLNDEVFMDLKATTLPSGHTFTPGVKAYLPASEVFTAYKSAVLIAEGTPNDISSTPLALKREVALMRVRVDKRAAFLNPIATGVDFNNAKNYLGVLRNPVGFGLKKGAFAGGIYATASDEKRIIIGSAGTTTFNTVDPVAATHAPTQIKDANFELWQEIRVLPNATKADNKAANALADNARKYNIVIAGWVKAGYEYADGTKATADQSVYWSAVINEVFIANTIREVNVTITSRGLPENPDVPTKEGGLTITVGAPESWSPTIQSTDVDV